MPFCVTACWINRSRMRSHTSNGMNSWAGDPSPNITSHSCTDLLPAAPAPWWELPELQFPGDKWEQDEMSHLQWDTLWAGSQYPSPEWHRLFLVQVPWTAAALTPGDVFWAGTCGEERKHRAHRHQHSTEIIKQEGEQRQLNVGGWADEIPDPWQSSLNLSSDISSLINPSAVRFPRIFNSQQ